MPLFNFRRAGSSSAKVASASQPDSVEIIRKRAKHRLIGASVLVLAGVIGFPLLFDAQPRPISVDIPIEIPGKESVKPLVLPAKPAPAKAASAAAAAAAPAVAAASSLAEKEEVVAEKKAAAPVFNPPPAIKKEAGVTRTDPTPKAASADGGKPAKATAGTPPKSEKSEPATSADNRLVVQVGAFADVVKAREARVKLEKAGLKTYTQVAQTAAGKRIRVRVGPFANRTEAEKAASKIKALDLPAAILTL